MTLEEQALETLQSARETYESMGHDNFEPMLHIVQEGDEHDAVIMMVGVPTGALYEAVQRVLVEIPLKPEIIFVINDAYGVRMPINMDDKARAYEEAQIALGEIGLRVPLSRRFAEGDPRVSEQLTVTALSAVRSVSIVQVYRWTPVDKWEWDEPMVNDANGSDWVWDRLVNGRPKPTVAEMMSKTKENGVKE